MIYTAMLVIAGTASGLITGLTPALHPNTVIFLSLPLAARYNPVLVLPFITSTAVSHSVVNHIPSILVGAPDPDSALAAIPGKKMLLEGKALEAVRIGLEGGLYAALFAIPLLAVSLISLKGLYTVSKPYLPFIISFLFMAMVIDNRNVMYSSVVAGISGMAGITAFSSRSINSSMVLFPLLTGLFGASTMISSLKSREIPEQREVEKETEIPVRGSIIGAVSGLIAGLIPGLGPSGTISIFARYLKSKKNFMSALGGINTSDALFSLLALYIIGRPRSGAAIAVQKLSDIGVYMFLKLTGIILVSIALAYLAGRSIAPRLVNLYKSMDKEKLIKTLLAALPVGIVATTGLGGLGIFLTATGIGLIADKFNVRKSVCMGCIILPVILHMFGVSAL
ncbi:MAG: tripartite tricarboxylate transporter permease [Candidatus Nanohaloarchaea archaeon]|nr:tripartite tricarboxylate transporter permease [Candidatus Nanohaloarchaea archaeon]